MAEWTQERLGAFGVPLPAGNRLQRARSLIEEVNERRVVLSSEDRELLERVNEAQWTVIEQYVIARALGRPPRRLEPAHLRKLEEMLSGADVPGADRNHFARNTQFELYVGSHLTMGDVRVVVAEPDLVIDYLGAPCGLAAKRVQSVRQAVRRAREAADQIAASGVRGIVAVNVDVLLGLSETEPDPTRTLDERLEVVREIEAAMAARDEVIATLTFAKTAIWDFSGSRPVVELSHSNRYTVHPRDGHTETQGREFFDRLFTRVDQRMEDL
ncbi:MAG: hypothetical protein AB7N29_18570 [Vicinamibacterales bacterium]